MATQHPPGRLDTNRTRHEYAVDAARTENDVTDGDLGDSRRPRQLGSRSVLFVLPFVYGPVQRVDVGCVDRRTGDLDADQSDPDAVSEGGGEMLEGSPDGGGEGGRPQGRPAPTAAPGGADPFAGSSAFDPEVRARAEPEAVFAENDENEDGKLESYEIPQISNQTKVKMDTDGDGVLTKEEWMAEMKPAAAEGEVESSEGEAAESEAAESDAAESDAAESEAAESDADATASQPELAEEPESAE